MNILKGIHKVLCAIQKESREPSSKIAKIVTCLEEVIQEPQMCPFKSPETLIYFLMLTNTIKPHEREWAVEYYTRDPRAFWTYIKRS